MTSGSKGMQLYAPLSPGPATRRLHAYAKGIAEELEAEHPDARRQPDDEVAPRPARCSSTGARTPARRPRSRRTRCAAASSRRSPRRARWAELEAGGAEQLTHDEVAGRLAADGDLVAPLLRKGPRLPV